MTRSGSSSSSSSSSSGRRPGDTQEDEPVTVLNTVLDTTVTDTTREVPMVRVPVRGHYVEDLWVDDRVPVLARPRGVLSGNSEDGRIVEALVRERAPRSTIKRPLPRR